MTAVTGEAPSFAELFTPKLWTILGEAYTAHHFRADAIAGLTVAIVALEARRLVEVADG